MTSTAIDFDENAPSKTILKGAAAHDIDTCFTTIANKIDNPHTPYKPKGPNSNTFVKTLLYICGKLSPSTFFYVAPDILPIIRERIWGRSDPVLVNCVYSRFDNSCN